ncbi:CdaR family protein [Alteribacter natronophilus]|uniref:CdaR family protein n=1 Tax=Alteribacter natronophilus TaxID=2583810 RepID=UPI00110E5003|nr:CdaR family protein [Alteribacter natronophilus]TMW70086.1 YbbR-like domain-containing protein [Alteribacter natronophilus]
MMDKWFNNKWFIRGISLFIAVMLYMMVSIDNVNHQQPGAGIPGITDGERVLQDVELTVLYDEDRYVVTEAPETVDVQLQGPQNLLMLQIARPQYEVFIDLRDQGAGEHYERVQYSGFQSELSVRVDPSTVRVTLQELQTSSFPVQVELLNEDEMESGYAAGSPSVTPSSVDVTAAEGLVNQIATARAFVDLSGVSESVDESVEVLLYDESGNEIDLIPDPPAVDVTVPVTSPNKEVPVRIDREGELPDGAAVTSIQPNPSTVTVFGPPDAIDEINFITGLTVDLSEITGSTVIELDVPVPEGAERVEPETIEVEVEIDEEETRVLSNFPFEITGLDEIYQVELLDPERAVFDLEVIGTSMVLARISSGDIEAFIDLDGLDAGEHSVPLTVTGPQNLRFDYDVDEVDIRVYDEEDAEEASTQSSPESIEEEQEDDVIEDEDDDDLSDEEESEEDDEEQEDDVTEDEDEQDADSS